MSSAACSITIERETGSREQRQEPGLPKLSSMVTAGVWLIGWLLATATLLPVSVLAGQIQVSLDRNPVPVSESFTLTFTAAEEPDDDPDFSPLQADFEILNQGHSSQFSIINGQATRRIAWQVQVLAKKTGTLQIPPITFGSDRSNAFAVTITNGPVRGKQGGEANIYLEAEAEPKNPYVQAQVILTLRVLSRVAFSGDLSQPEVPDAVVEKLEEDREYVTLRDGVQFKVDERRFAVFPQKSGRLTIGPVNLTAQLAGSGSTGFGPFFRPSTRQQRLHSEPIELDVRPIPAQFTGRHWLPASRLELGEQWSPASLKIPSGEPVTRTVTIRVEGATLGMLPELQGPDLPAEVRQYPDQPVTKEEKSSTGINSQRQHKIALMATRQGNFTVPALEVPWWNTVTDRMEIARLPGQKVTVTPVAGQLPVPEPGPPPSEKLSAATIPSELPTEKTGQITPEHGDDTLWFWLAVLSGSGWALTALAWWISTRPKAASNLKSQPEDKSSERILIKAVETSCKANDPFAARRAVDNWAAYRWPDRHPADWVNQLSDKLAREVNLLGRYVYGNVDKVWTGDNLLKEFIVFRRYKSFEERGNLNGRDCRLALLNKL